MNTDPPLRESSSHIVVNQEHPWLGYGGGKAGKNWKGASGLSMERWIFWKKRFGEIKGHEMAAER